MELRQLEYFCKIADTGSVSEAARRLNMSQPPLSYQLRRLEEELNVKLLSRTSRGVELTEAGRLLHRRAGSLLEYARSTRDEVSESGKKRVLRMGITSTTVPTILPAITRYVRSHPDVNFEVRDGASMTLLQHLLDGIIDISVARTPLRLATAVFPRSMSSLCTGLRIRPLAEKELETQTVLIWKRDGRLSSAAREFIDACREEFGIAK